MTKILDMVPEFVDKFTRKKEKETISDQDAAKAAFDEEEEKQ